MHRRLCLVLVFLLIVISRFTFAAIYPVGGKTDHSGFKITLGYGESWYCSALGKWLWGHTGLDFVATDGQSQGKPVVAIADGAAVFSGDGGTNWGPVLVLKHVINNQTYYSQYAHLQNLAINKGQVIHEGDQIGEIGKLPMWAAHLHFELKTQEAIDTEGNGYVGHGYSGRKDGIAPNRISLDDFIKNHPVSSATPPKVLLTSKIVTLSSSTGDSVSVLARDVQNFTLTFKVNVAYREGSVFFRLSDDRGNVQGFRDGLNGYGLIFCPLPDQGANPGVFLVKRENGQEKVLVVYRYLLPFSSSTATFKLIVNGPRMTVYKDNQIVLFTKDDGFKIGRLAWRVFGDQNLPAEATFSLYQLIPTN